MPAQFLLLADICKENKRAAWFLPKTIKFDKIMSVRKNYFSIRILSAAVFAAGIKSAFWFSGKTKVKE